MKRLLFACAMLLASLSPASAQHLDLVETAANDDRFSTLVAAVKAAGLVETLQGDGPFTIFAPTNAAFAALPAGTVDDLLRPENLDRLQAILTFHVVAGRIEAHDLLSTSAAETASGVSLPIGLSIGGATIIETDVMATNGIIHVIDSVLLPADLPSAAGSASTDVARLIEAAIERGAPLYNRGQIGACVAVYEVAATALLAFADLPGDARSALREGLNSRSHGVDDRAWQLREGLDMAYRSAQRRMMRTAAGH